MLERRDPSSRMLSLHQTTSRRVPISNGDHDATPPNTGSDSSGESGGGSSESPSSDRPSSDDPSAGQGGADSDASTDPSKR